VRLARVKFSRFHQECVAGSVLRFGIVTCEDRVFAGQGDGMLDCVGIQLVHGFNAFTDCGGLKHKCIVDGFLVILLYSVALLCV
jgi:hypothetical protein